MAFVVSNWGGDKHMKWLTHGTCSGGCNVDDVHSQFKNLVFRTADYVPPVEVEEVVDNRESSAPTPPTPVIEENVFEIVSPNPNRETQTPEVQVPADFDLAQFTAGFLRSASNRVCDVTQEITGTSDASYDPSSLGCYQASAATRSTLI